MIRFALQKDCVGKKETKKKKDCVEGWIKGGESRSKKEETANIYSNPGEK